MWLWLKNIVSGIIKPKKMGLIIDLSRNNGIVDFAKVKTDPQGITGCILKASEGVGNPDKKFLTNVDGCVKNGLDWGAYHFATWNNENEKSDAMQEANFFLSVVKSTQFKPSLSLVLDIESNKPIPYTKDEMVIYVSTFIKVIMDAGFSIAIYSSPGFLTSYLPANHPFTNNLLWIADYTGEINPVPGWKKVWLHQYTDSGKVNGISTNVDLNKFV